MSAEVTRACGRAARAAMKAGAPGTGTTPSVSAVSCASIRRLSAMLSSIGRSGSSAAMVAQPCRPWTTLSTSSASSPCSAAQRRQQRSTTASEFTIVLSMSSSRARAVSVVVAVIGGLLGATGIRTVRPSAGGSRMGRTKWPRPPVRECGRNHFVSSRYKTDPALDNQAWSAPHAPAPARQAPLRLVRTGLQGRPGPRAVDAVGIARHSVGPLVAGYGGPYAPRRSGRRPGRYTRPVGAAAPVTPTPPGRRPPRAARSAPWAGRWGRGCRGSP